MRWLAPTVLLALLAACTVTTTGAPCSSDLNCPTSQGCGSDGKCWAEALACPGHTTDGECRPGRSCVAGQLVTCTAAGGVCSTQTEAACSDPGETCVAAGGNAACVCPTLNACTQVDATRCNAGGDQVLVCKPVVAGSACLSWQTATNCASSSLVCSAGACACPANPGPIFHADAEGGSGAGAIPSPTGAAAPAACRFKSLTVALAAANALGSGATAKAAGWSAATPGGVMLF
jgi:hypothetical protein